MMTPEDIVDVLTKAAAFDQRTVGEADVLAWHEVLHRLDLADALAAVSRHYTESRERIMPADVVRLVRAIREERARIERRHEVRELPGKFEDDAGRDARLKAGTAKVRKVIAPIVARLSMPGFERTKREARGAWWEDEHARERHAVHVLAEQQRLHLRCDDPTCPTCHQGGDH